MGKALSIVLWLVPMVCFALLLVFWPQTNLSKTPVFCPWLTGEIRMMLIVLISGAIGASLDAARNYSAFLGRGNFDAKWTAWYLFRIPQGMGLALILYLVVRGGLVPSTGASTGDNSTINPFGFAAMSALAGMFAKPAMQRLEQVFTSLFGEDDAPPADPVLDQIATTVSVNATGDQLRVKLTGSGFTQKSTGLVGDDSRDLSYKSGSEVTLTLLPADVAVPDNLKVRVANGSAKSEWRELKVV